MLRRVWPSVVTNAQIAVATVMFWRLHGNGNQAANVGKNEGDGRSVKSFVDRKELHYPVTTQQIECNIVIFFYFCIFLKSFSKYLFMN